MSDIPVISITQECSDDELEDATSKMNIAEAHTDTEDLIMDQDTVRFRKGSPTVTGGAALIDAIKPTINGALTDVEDCTDSEEEAEEEVKSAREADIALDNFLDQGYVDETANSNDTGVKPKTLTRSFSKAAESQTLQVTLEPTGALTDCEDCALSDDDDSLGKVSIPDCPDDILTKDNGNDAVDIHNIVKRKQEKHIHKQEAADGSSSDSDNDNRVRHRKYHRKAEDRPRSDYEQITISDDEAAGACAKVPAERQSALFEAEELVMEGSDIEEDKSHMFPEINITFVSDGHEMPIERLTKVQKPMLTVQEPNAEEALTDVENLDSSGSDDDKEGPVNRLMPRAVVRSGGRSGGLTDVEDFDDSDDNEEQEQNREVPLEFLPSPVREIAIVKHDESGEQQQNVMPLNQGILTVRTPDIEQAATDVEDLSDNECAELYDTSKYAADTLPEVEHGAIYSSDNPSTKGAKLELKSPIQDPVTDTEDLFFERNASMSGTGSELRRRRKPKQCHAHGSSMNGSSSHQCKSKKHLEMKMETTATATTDVEDMYLSDDGKECSVERAKQRRATIQFSTLHTAAATNECDGKTDVEFMSGDELVNEYPTQTPLFCIEGFSSIVKARERNGPFKVGAQEYQPIPMIRKISPSPDAHNCHTDCEDIQMASDDEEKGGNYSYSRAQTATPFELTRALDESGRCEIHETNTRPKPELLDIKGAPGTDQQEIHTDVEFLEDDVGNAADH